MIISIDAEKKHFLYKSTNPITRATPSGPNYLPRTLLQIPSHRGLGVQHIFSGGRGHTDIHCPSKSFTISFSILLLRLFCFFCSSVTRVVSVLNTEFNSQVVPRQVTGDISLGKLSWKTKCTLSVSGAAQQSAALHCSHPPRDGMVLVVKLISSFIHSSFWASAWSRI